MLGDIGVSQVFQMCRFNVFLSVSLSAVYVTSLDLLLTKVYTRSMRTYRKLHKAGRDIFCLISFVT